jgi:ribose transport system substrate-binding protein
MKKIFAIVLALMLVLSAAAMAEVNTKVALITMDQMDEHWISVKQGADDKVAELNAQGNNIEMVWLAPETKDNQQQIEKINAAVADNVNYIIIAANDATSCNRALEEAIDAGIKIIYVDATATIPAEAVYATDNFKGGVLAGEYMKKLLADNGVTEGMIGIVDAQPGVQSCQDRYDGFASVFEGSAFTLGERQYSDGDNSKAQELATTLINNGVVAIYGTNNGAANGAAAACKDAAANGKKIWMVGWDKSGSNLAHVEADEMQGFVAQNPYQMGYMAIEGVFHLESVEDLAGKTFKPGDRKTSV